MTDENTKAAISNSDLVGTWKLKSAVVDRDGILTDMYGPSPMGIEIFQADGHFSTICARADVQMFASANREQATLEESLRGTKGGIGYWGTYTMRENQLVTFHIEGSTFPNWRGMDQNRTYTLTGDTMIWNNPTPSAGGKALFTWQRVTRLPA